MQIVIELVLKKLVLKKKGIVSLQCGNSTTTWPIINYTHSENSNMFLYC